MSIRRHTIPVARLRRRRHLVEALEPRTLFAVPQPLATPAAFTTIEDTPISTRIDRTYLAIDGSGYIYDGQGVWTTADRSFNLGDDASAYGFALTLHDPAPPPHPSDDWFLNFAPAANEQIIPTGTYNDAHKIYSLTTPFIDVYGYSHGSSTTDGSFVARVYTLADDQSLATAAINFHQVADNGAGGTLDGMLEYHVPINTAPGDAPVVTTLVTTAAHGTVVLHPDGTFTYTPAADFYGDDGFTYTATDGLTTTAPLPVTIHVTPVDDPPTFNVGPDITVNEDAGPQAFARWVKNLNPGPTNEAAPKITFVVRSNTNRSLFVSGVSVNSAGTLSFTPAHDANGSATIGLAVYDASTVLRGIPSNLPIQYFHITVNSVPDAPIATDDYFNVPAGQPFSPPVEQTSIHVVTSGVYGTGDFYRTDADGTLTAAHDRTNPSVIVNYGSASDADFPGAFLQFFSDTLSGVVAVGVYPNPDSSTGDYGQVLNITIHDSPNRLTESQTHIIQSADAPDGTLQHFSATFIAGQFGGPTGDGDAYGTVEYHATGGLLADDYHVDKLALTAILVTQTAHGTLHLNPDGTFTYTPAAGYIGADSFTYKVAADGLESLPAIVHLNVLPINQPPSFSIGPDLTYDFNPGAKSIDHFATALSPGPAVDAGQTLSFSVISDSNYFLFDQQPAIDSTGRLTFTPTTYSSGTATITILLKDSGGTAHGGQDTSASQTFNITIRPAPTPPPTHGGGDPTPPSPPVKQPVTTPVAHDDIYDVDANSSFTPDPTRPITSLIVHGDPGEKFGGGQSFYITRDDGKFGADGSASSVRINFSYTNGFHVPVFWLLSFSDPLNPLVPGDYAAPVNVTGNSPYLEIFNAIAVGAPQYNGDFTVLEYENPGADAHLGVDFVQYSFGNQAAALRGFLRYNYIEYPLLANDDVPDGKTLAATLLTSPAHGTLAFAADGSFTYTPNLGFVGTDSFTYRASDGSTDTAPATVTLRVNAPFDNVADSGLVQNVYPANDGTPLTTPLASWTVFDDVNGNGAFDHNEPSAITDLNGRYTLHLSPTTTHTLRLVEKKGWVVPAGGNYGDSFALDLTSSAGSAYPTLSTSMANPTVVNVLALYVPSGTLDWEHYVLPPAFNYANSVYANSDTNIRINFVGAVAVNNYTRASDLGEDLYRLVDPTDGYFRNAGSLRNKYDADIVALFLNGPDNYEDYGVAPMLQLPTPHPDLGYIAVTHDAKKSIAGPNSDGVVLAHELGHTFGAGHDRENEAHAASPYGYGYRFKLTPKLQYRDVMSYDPGTPIPFLSSPNLFYQGHALGTATADNARMVRENAYIVANYRGSATALPGYAPAPVSITVPKTPLASGAKFAASVVVRNPSGSPYVGKFAVTFYLSLDKTFDLSDTRLGVTAFATGPLGSKQSRTLTAANLKLPAGLAPGTYYLVAVATTGGPALATAIKVGSAAKPQHAKPLLAAFQTTRSIGTLPVPTFAPVANFFTDPTDDDPIHAAIRRA